jgi:hypothetical protein
MRPAPKQQNPTSFIRKWPKARRALRGPSEYFETFTIQGLQSMLEAAGLVRQMSDAVCKPGWKYSVSVASEFSALHAGYTATAKVRFFRIPKEGK